MDNALRGRNYDSVVPGVATKSKLFPNVVDGLSYEASKPSVAECYKNDSDYAIMDDDFMGTEKSLSGTNSYREFRTADFTDATLQVSTTMRSRIP